MTTPTLREAQDLPALLERITDALALRLGTHSDEWADVHAARALLDAQPAPEAGPVAWVDPRNVASAKIAQERGGPFDAHVWSEGKTSIHTMPLYAAPVAQPAPAVAHPDGLMTAVRLVLEATPDQLPMALDALRDHAAGAVAQQGAALTDAQANAMWVAATIERTDMRSVYLRGLRDGESAHGITATQATTTDTGEQR